MLFGLVDQSDVQTWLALEQTGGRADSSGTCSDDHHSEMLHARSDRLLRGATLDTVCKVETRRAPCCQQWLGGSSLGCLIHGPEIG